MGRTLSSQTLQVKKTRARTILRKEKALWAQGALRLLESQLKDLQTNLCSYIGKVETMRNLPMGELAHSLHGTSLSVSSLVIGFIQFMTSCTYVSIDEGQSRRPAS
jgi:hypothetical protein